MRTDPRSRPKGGSMPSVLKARLGWAAAAILAMSLSTQPVAAQWTPAGLQGYTISALVADPSAPLTLFAGTNLLGVFQSTDGGATWRGLGPTGAHRWNITSLAVDPGSEHIYAGTTHGVIVGDIDSHWSAPILTIDDPSAGNDGVTALALDPNQPGRILAAGFGVW